MAQFAVVIPARHASTRLPGKPLLDIAGSPMVVHVARRARASGAAEVIVATDHAEIAATVERHGFSAAMTGEHPSGTDRIAEVARRRGWNGERIVVNVQGDEPLIEPQLVARVAAKLADCPDASIATACCALGDAAELANPNIVKVVCDRSGYALYFSRAPIPFPRDAWREERTSLPSDFVAYRHIGLYAYRCSFLAAYSGLEQAPLERYEALEQLRALWHGYRIAVAAEASAPPAGVDTADDLARVRALLGNEASRSHDEGPR